MNKNKKSRCFKAGLVTAVSLFLIITAGFALAGDGSLNAPIDPRDIVFDINKPFADFALVVTDTVTGKVTEFRPYSGYNLSASGEPVRNLYIRQGRDIVQVRNLSTSSGNPVSKLDLQIHSTNYPGGQDLRMLCYQDFPYNDLENISIPAEGEYDVFLNALGESSLDFYTSVNGQHRALKLNVNGKYYYWYFVQMRIISVTDPKLPEAVITDNATEIEINSLCVKEGSKANISAAKSHFPSDVFIKYYTWEIKSVNSSQWSFIEDYRMNIPVPDMPVKPLGEYDVRLTVHYYPYEYMGNSSYDYWSFSRSALSGSKVIKLTVTPSNLIVNLSVSSSPDTVIVSDSQIAGNNPVNIQVSASASLSGFSGPDSLIEEWSLYFQKFAPPDNDFQYKYSDRIYIPSKESPSAVYSDVKTFTTPSVWVQNSGAYSEKYQVEARVRISGIWYSSGIKYCSSSLKREGIAVNAALTPLVVKSGQEITITANTTGYADKLEFIFPEEVYNLDPVLKSTSGKITVNITPSKTASNSLKYRVPAGTYETLDKGGNILRLPYRVLVKAYKSNGDSAATYVSFDVQGSITDGLVTRRR